MTKPKRYYVETVAPLLVKNWGGRCSGCGRVSAGFYCHLGDDGEYRLAERGFGFVLEDGQGFDYGYVIPSDSIIQVTLEGDDKNAHGRRCSERGEATARRTRASLRLPKAIDQRLAAAGFTQVVDFAQFSGKELVEAKVLSEKQAKLLDDLMTARSLPLGHAGGEITHRLPKRLQDRLLLGVANRQALLAALTRNGGKARPTGGKLSITPGRLRELKVLHHWARQFPLPESIANRLNVAGFQNIMDFAQFTKAELVQAKVLTGAQAAKLGAIMRQHGALPGGATRLKALLPPYMVKRLCRNSNERRSYLAKLKTEMGK